MFDVKSFKERLRAKRESLGINQEDFAKKIDIARASASYYENVKNTSLPNAEVLYRMAECLDVSVDYLLGRSETEHPEYLNINKATSLSEYAVAKLQEENDKELLNTFDALVCHEWFFEFLSYVAACVYPDGDWAKRYEVQFAEIVKQEHERTPQRFKANYRDRYSAVAASAYFSKWLENIKETGRGD